MAWLLILDTVGTDRHTPGRRARDTGAVMTWEGAETSSGYDTGANRYAADASGLS